MTHETMLLAENALCDAAQFIDAVKQDALREGWWTEWDGQMREKLTAALRAIDVDKKAAKVPWDLQTR